MSEGEPERGALSDCVLLWCVFNDVTPTLKGLSGGQLSLGMLLKVQRTAARQEKK
jgi:hypothetical protein